MPNINDELEPKKRSSLSNARKYIDEFIKANAQFRPFEVTNIGSYGNIKGEILTIIGIRKDGRFISVNSKGVKQQIASYNEKDYAVPNPDNAPINERIEDLKKQRNAINKKIEAEESKLVWDTLEQRKLRKMYAEWLD